MIVVKYWFSSNWGDVASFELVKRISGIVPKFISVYENETNSLNYIVMGSILRYTDPETVVWGAGFLTDKDKCRKTPKQILAVRGPLSRATLLKQGIDCPEVYGDPAILYPNVYNPKIEKKYKLGIIPHWQDYYKYTYLSEAVNKDILFIRPTRRWNASAVFDYINQIISCEKIASASLHGLIVADAYKIPNVQICFNRLSDFKFNDYFGSIGRTFMEPIDCSVKIDEDKIFNSPKNEYIIDTTKLLGSCPFKRGELKEES